VLRLTHAAPCLLGQATQAAATPSSHSKNQKLGESGRSVQKLKSFVKSLGGGGKKKILEPCIFVCPLFKSFLY